MYRLMSPIMDPQVHDASCSVHTFVVKHQQDGPILKRRSSTE